MPQPIAVVDAFTAEPYRGNPAGICVLPAPASDAWMQSVAIEMNHAETAFLIKRGASNEDGYDLRWFTPGGEVDLCGHATLGSAHYLWESEILGATVQARFHTRSGLLTAERFVVDGTPWIELDFPSEPVSPAVAPKGLAAMLGADPVFVGRNRMDHLVELKDESTVRSLKPDLKQIALFPKQKTCVASLSRRQERMAKPTSSPAASFQVLGSMKTRSPVPRTARSLRTGCSASRNRKSSPIRLLLAAAGFVSALQEIASSCEGRQ